MKKVELHEAVRRRDIDLVRSLLTPENVNEKEKYTHMQNTPLHEAIIADDIEIIKLLLAAGADGTLKNALGDTVLGRALETEKSFEVIKLLVDAGTDVNCRDFIDQTPLHVVVRKNSVQLTEYFLSKSADVNAMDSNNRTPLHYAAKCNRGESRLNVVEKLLNNGAKVNAQNKQGETPLHNLVKVANRRMIELFLEFKADVNVQNSNGEIPLFEAIRNENRKIIQLLIDNGSPVNAKSHTDSTPLHCACQCGNDYIIKRLFENGADVDAVDSRGCTPIMSYLKYFHISSLNHNHHGNTRRKIRFLLKYSDTSKINSEGKHILNIASQSHTCGRVILEFIAKQRAIDPSLCQNFLDCIEKDSEYKDYYKNCSEELALAKATKVQNSWINYFDLLTDNKTKLKNYAGNEFLVEEFKKCESLNNFPIYGIEILQNVSKGVYKRKLYDESCILLSITFPIFNPNHLIIRDILDSLPSVRDLEKLCGCY